MKKPGRVREVFCDLDLYVSCLALAVLVVLTVSGVAMRYAVNQPLHWMEEVQLMCFVWVVFLGAGAVARRNAHIGIDAIVTLFPNRVQKAAGIFSQVVSIVVLVFLGYYASRYVMQMYQSHRLTSILGIPYFVIYLAVPLSCLTMACTSFWMLCTGRVVKKKEEYA